MCPAFAGMTDKGESGLFTRASILSKYKEGDNKDLDLWFIVSGSWLKETTGNYKPETRDFFFTNDIRFRITAMSLRLGIPVNSTMVY